MNFYARHSIVDKIQIDSISQSAQLHIGDSKQITSKNYVLAKQKQEANFTQNELGFNNFQFFFKPLKLQPLTKELNMTQFHQYPIIKVGEILVEACAASALVHIGSTELIFNESRIKNIRDFYTGSETSLINKLGPENGSESQGEIGKPQKATLKFT